MEQSTRERDVCDILLNLTNLIRKSETRSGLLVWGARGKRSAIDSARSSPPPPEKKPRIGDGDYSPVTPLSFSASESDHRRDKQSRKKKTREELLGTINELVEARESLMKEIKRVKDYHNNLEAYNKVLKAKQQQLQFQESEPNSDLSKSLNLGKELSQNRTPFAFLLENHQQAPQFLSLFQQQHFIFQYPCNQTPLLTPLPTLPSSIFPTRADPVCQPGIPDLNVAVYEVPDAEYLQPSDRTIQALGDDNRMRAAEARKRRMVRVKERKLNLNPFKPPRC